MLIIETKNYAEMSKVGAKLITEEIKRNPNLVIGLATGRTPLGLYKELIKAYKNKKVDFSKATWFNLDEYYPIEKNNKNSFFYYLNKNFFEKINANKKNINFLNGETKNPYTECKNYEKKLKKNPLDVLILGIGANCHIAFNEPGSSFKSKTRLVSLKKETIKSIKNFKKKDIPKKALTIGISDILKSKKIILLASGKSKAKAVKNLIEKKINKKFPATILKKHENFILIIDKKASSLLKNFN